MINSEIGITDDEFDKELQNFFENLKKNQQSLGKEFSEIIDDDIEEIYET